MAKLDRFDGALPPPPWVSPWQSDGTFAPDLDLLATLLGLAAGTAQASGIVAGAADMWAAHELRRAGFDRDEVWPRSPAPRVMPRDIANMMRSKGGGLTGPLRRQLQVRYPKMTKSLPAEADVLGAVYSKQADVLIASWSAGIELMISTKTMLSSFSKNLRNRFEEAYGDARNLRTRHPMASLGFLYVLSGKASASDLEFAEDMLRKLRQPAAYDAVTLVLIDTAAQLEDDEDAEQTERPPDEEAPSLAVEPVADEEAEADDPDEPAAAEDADDQTGTVEEVTILDVPQDLNAARFFQDLIGAALTRTPIGMYKAVRELIEAAKP